MEHDTQKIIENMNSEWTAYLSNANFKVAMLQEDNRKLREELEFYKQKAGEGNED